jgi:hypothetical protein
MCRWVGPATCCAVLLLGHAAALGADPYEAQRKQFDAHVAAKRYREAESLGRQMLGIAEKSAKDNPPRLAAILNDLAMVYYQQRRFGEAEPAATGTASRDRCRRLHTVPRPPSADSRAKGRSKAAPVAVVSRVKLLERAPLHARKGN